MSSFGFGGVNAHVVLEEYVDTRSPVVASGPVMVVLSAKNEERLKEQARQLMDALDRYEEADLARIAYTLQVGREAMESRVAMTVSSFGRVAREVGAVPGGRGRRVLSRRGEAE